MAARAVRRSNPLTVVTWSQVIGLLPYFPALLVVGDYRLPSPSTLGVVFAASLVVTAAYLALYKGLRVGKVSLVTPISACWALVTVMITSVLLGEPLTQVQTLAVGLAVVGGASASFRWGDFAPDIRRAASGVQYALAAMLAFGAYYVFLDVLVSELGWFLPILFVRVVMVAILVASSFAARGGVARPTGVGRLVLLAGLLDFAAFLFYSVGIYVEYSAIVAPISAASPVVTIVLARLLLGERLEANQKIGIAAVMAAVMLMSL